MSDTELALKRAFAEQRHHLADVAIEIVEGLICPPEHGQSEAFRDGFEHARAAMIASIRIAMKGERLG